MNGNNTAGLIATGFVVGALAGAVAGLLLAPKSGKETRQMIKARLGAFRGKNTGSTDANGAEQHEDSPVGVSS